ncbi:MAG TPA: hypothetical protein VE783_05755 [Candidatus Limnocylindrales bacterium]|jgi:hypothetical protein|nr:hypothetical protein [Candidatus Limnocylindrales bacterium]
MSRPFWKRFTLAASAVILGNVLYLWIQRFLPPNAQHQAFRIDLGLVADFWLCVVLYSVFMFLYNKSRH